MQNFSGTPRLAVNGLIQVSHLISLIKCSNREATECQHNPIPTPIDLLDVHPDLNPSHTLISKYDMMSWKGASTVFVPNLRSIIPTKL